MSKTPESIVNPVDQVVSERDTHNSMPGIELLSERPDLLQASKLEIPGLEGVEGNILSVHTNEFLIHDTEEPFDSTTVLFHYTDSEGKDRVTSRLLSEIPLQTETKVDVENPYANTELVSSILSGTADLSVPEVAAAATLIFEDIRAFAADRIIEQELPHIAESVTGVAQRVQREIEHKPYQVRQMVELTEELSRALNRVLSEADTFRPSPDEIEYSARNLVRAIEEAQGRMLGQGLNDLTDLQHQVAFLNSATEEYMSLVGRMNAAVEEVQAMNAGTVDTNLQEEFLEKVGTNGVSRSETVAKQGRIHLAEEVVHTARPSLEDLEDAFRRLRHQIQELPDAGQVQRDLDELYEAASRLMRDPSNPRHANSLVTDASFGPRTRFRQLEETLESVYRIIGLTIEPLASSVSHAGARLNSAL